MSVENIDSDYLCPSLPSSLSSSVLRLGSGLGELLCEFVGVRLELYRMAGSADRVSIEKSTHTFLSSLLSSAL